MNYGVRHINFYRSKAWQDVRKNVWLRQNLLCNKCHKPVYVDGISDFIPKHKRVKGIVHHIEHIDDNNIQDINITLNPDNLEGLCIYCHNDIHTIGDAIRKEYYFDDMGNIVKR